MESVQGESVTLVLPEDEFAFVRRIWALLEVLTGDGGDAELKISERSSGAGCYPELE